MSPRFPKFISGGQTCAERGALDFAIRNNIVHGGWCPKGRKAQDGAIPAIYQLQETLSDDYLESSEWNVRDSDATVIFTNTKEHSDMSQCVVDFARKHQKPWLHLGADSYTTARDLSRFMGEHEIGILNVTGASHVDVMNIFEGVFFWRWRAGIIGGPDEG